MSAHDSLFSGPGVSVAPRYARHVGRVGALAVALGVGAAFASMPTASADSTSADSTSSSGSTAADSGSASGPDPDVLEHDPGDPDVFTDHAGA